MTTEKQRRANGRNALKSTGPKSATGKKRVRCNAIKHGLTAVTVVTPQESVTEYKRFEDALYEEFQPESVVERELVGRLGSILWRLRRAVSFETAYFELRHKAMAETTTCPTLVPLQETFSDQISGSRWVNSTAETLLSLAPADRPMLDLVLRYETSLSRQLRQTLICLHEVRHRIGSHWLTRLRRSRMQL